MLRFFMIAGNHIHLAECLECGGRKGHPLLESDRGDDHKPAALADRKKEWGPNQCENDKDGSVDHDERLKITGVEPGTYDVKFRDNLHRECVIKNIDIKTDGIFSIEEKKLVGFCHMF